jgi:hypothetical protein
LQPIWLWASAAIVIPIAIHLWNKKQNKTLKIGSVIFLEESAVPSSKSLQLTEILLLLLRCLLIVLLSLLLAKPQWHQSLQSNQQKGWILLDAENITETYEHFKPEIDSLLKQDFEFHYFKEGFAKEDFKDALVNKADTNYSKISYWLLADKLQQQNPSSAFIFTSNQLTKFTGNAKSLNNIHWQTYSPKDSLSAWIEEAYTTVDDSIQLVVANSSADKTIYSLQTIPLSIANKKSLSVSFDKYSAKLDTSTLTVGLFADENSELTYVQSAVKAIQQFSKRKIKLIAVNEKTIAKFDWLFWLSVKTIPPQINFKNSFVYATGRTETVYTKFSLNSMPIRFYKIIHSEKNNRDEIIWQDGLSNKILTEQNNEYIFYSRFTPEWNDLVWSKSFPEIIYQLLYKSKTEINKSDKRIISNQQIQSLITTIKNSVSNKTTSTDISFIFWLSVFTVLLIERWLSFKSKKQF